MSNFRFLKDIDKNLYDIANEAEKLYRDEYFEQCMGQTRRFAENLCRKMMGSKVSAADTFDDMLNNLKDSSTGSAREKEFIEDLYFLKKSGNQSLHSGKVKQDGIAALECVQRAFEAAVNYAMNNSNNSEEIARLRFDTELLATGKASRKTLKEKYTEQKVLQKEDSSKTQKVKKRSKPSCQTEYEEVQIQKEKQKFSLLKLITDNYMTITTVIVILFIIIKAFLATKE